MREDPERYVDRHELAALTGWHVSTIDRRVRAGMPSYLWGARSRRFLPTEATAWLNANEQKPATTVTCLDDRRPRVQ